jgi:hypothetical protein
MIDLVAGASFQDAARLALVCPLIATAYLAI